MGDAADERMARIRRAARARRDRDPTSDEPRKSIDPDEVRAERRQRLSAGTMAETAAARIREAESRGVFDDNPYRGKPLPGNDGRHDPDWWMRSLIQRERVTGLGPPALMLRKEDAELDARLDEEHDEEAVRRMVDDFNARVVAARRQLLGGPPVITKTRDAEAEVARWRERRRAAEEQPSEPEAADAGDRGRTRAPRRGRLFRRRRR